MMKLVGLLVSLTIGVVLMWAAPARADDYPQVANLTPFSAECNYMSQAGYLRLLVYQRDGFWLARDDATSIAIQQRTQVGE